MRKYESGTRWCAWRWTDRGHLVRLHLVQTPWFSVMLHWLKGADPQRHLHDHPVDLASVVLRGGYVEEFQWHTAPRTPEWSAGGWDDQRPTIIRRRWSVVRRPAELRHRVAAVLPGTLTLAFAGPVRRAWGYWVNGRFVPWREYWKTPRLA